MFRIIKIVGLFILMSLVTVIVMIYNVFKAIIHVGKTEWRDFKDNAYEIWHGKPRPVYFRRTK